MIMEGGKSKSAVWAGRLETSEVQRQIKFKGSLPKNPLLNRGQSLSSVRAFSDWMSSTHNMEGNLLYSQFVN